MQGLTHCAIIVIVIIINYCYWFYHLSPEWSGSHLVLSPSISSPCSNHRCDIPLSVLPSVSLESSDAAIGTGRAADASSLCAAAMH